MPATASMDWRRLSSTEQPYQQRWHRRRHSNLSSSSSQGRRLFVTMLQYDSRRLSATGLAVQSLLRRREAVRDLQKQRAEAELEAALAKTAFEKRALELQELTFQRQKELHDLTLQHKKELLKHQKELHELTLHQKKELHELTIKQQKCALEKQLLELEKLKKDLMQ